jgi:hypothetical protein
MKPMRLGWMLSSAWLAGCSLVYSPADRQLGPDQQGSPVHRSDDENELVRDDAGRSLIDEGTSSDDVEETDQTESDMSSDWTPDDEEVDMSPDESPDERDAGAGLDAGDVDPDETEPDAGPMCGGGDWQGCRADCAVCMDKLAEYPRYLQNHPQCPAGPSCNGTFGACDARCPEPTDADRDVLECNGSPGGWNGCRGTGCWVCNELVQAYPRYAQNHPACIVNYTCSGQFYTCNAACPAPTEADR